MPVTKPSPSDSQTDAVIEVKGSQSTVTVSWDKKNEEGGEGDDGAETGTNESAQMMDTGKDVYGNPTLILHHLFFFQKKEASCFETNKNNPRAI